jgi:hypothetical protein
LQIRNLFLPVLRVGARLRNGAFGIPRKVGKAFEQKEEIEQHN